MNSIVALIVNYRDAHRTAKCVYSLLNEVVSRCVVWDNSGDGGHSASELRALLDLDSRIDVTVSPENLGFAAGVNRGLEICRQHVPGAWVLLINNDAIAPPELVQRLRERLEFQPGAVLAFPALMHAGRRLDEVYYQRWLGLIMTRPGLGAFRVPRGCCLMLATDRWSGPLFDEDFFMYGEEIALGWMLRNHPVAMCLAEDVCVEHEGSASSGIGSSFYEERTVAAHLILTKKLGRNCLERLSLLASKIPMLLLRATMRALRYRSIVPFVALGRGWSLYLGATRSPGSSV